MTAGPSRREHLLRESAVKKTEREGGEKRKIEGDRERERGREEQRHNKEKEQERHRNERGRREERERFRKRQRHRVPIMAINQELTGRKGNMDTD